MKRTYTKIRLALLKAISGKQKTINEISKISGVNWKTVQRHIVFFKGSGLVNEVFSSPYVRIIELTALGEAELKQCGGGK